MPYQRSTQASGFKKRTGPDESKQLRQYATALDTRRKQEVKDQERQGVQLTNEMTRIDALASKKDTYELNNLRNFSKTLNTFLDTMATKVVKPVFDQQIEDGVTLGVRYQQGDPDAIAKVEASEKQLEEIESRIKEQELKVAQSTEAIQNSWDKENYRASLEEEYRLLNIKKLGSNRAFGFRKGILMESATGWDAFRDSSLLYNEDNPDSTENIGTEDDPIIVGQYHSYTGEEGQEKKKAILGHLTNKYIVEKGKESGLSTLFINKYLTNPILEQNAKFQQKEAQTARLEEAAAASEDNKEAISLGIDGVDADNGKELTDSIQKFILTEPANQRGMNTAGSKVVNANDLLVEVLVGEGAQLRTGSHANVDDQEDVLTILETAKFEVPGITKKGEKKTLPELWPSKFNMDEIRAKLLKETGSLEQERRTAIKNEALGEKVTILQAYHKDRHTKNYEASVALMKSNEKYIGILDAKFFTDMDAERDTLSYNEDASRKKLKEIRKGYGDNPIPSDHAIVRKLHPDVLEEAEENGWIAADLFADDNEAKATHNANAKALLADVENQFKKDYSGFKWSDENDQVTAANSLIESTLRKYTREYYKLGRQDNPNYSLSEAVGLAKIQLKKEMKADWEGEILPVKLKNGETGTRDPVWTIQEDQGGFVNSALNQQHELTATSPTDVYVGRNNTLDKTQQLITDSYDDEIFSHPDYSPVVDLEDFELVDGKVKHIWREFSQIDPLSRSPELLYTIQAQKTPGVEVPQWDAETQLEITKWESIPPEIKKKLIGGDRVSGGRALQEIGVLDLDTTISTALSHSEVWEDFNITEDELPTILKSLGLQSMNLEEVKANPQLLKSLFKKKILNITEQVQTVTTDQNQAIRMIFAGIKFGDINEWNNPYTLAALNSYYSGDDSALKKLNSTFNMNPYEVKGVNIQANEIGIETSWDINVLDQELGQLEQEVPPKRLLVEDGFIPTTRPNPEYQRWSARVQLLNDKKAFINAEISGEVLPQDQGRIFNAGKRIVGVDRYTDLQNEVINKYPNLRINDAGVIIDPAVGNKRIGTKLFEARDMLQTLLFNEVRGGQTVDQSDIIDEDGVLGTPLLKDEDQYQVGSDYAGNFEKGDLVEVSGYGKTGKGETIQIRKDVAEPLENMLDAAAKDGVFLNFSPQENYGSGYRTKKGSQKALDMGGRNAVAQPGYSTHNLGTGVDFLSLDEKSLAWLQENGPKYGFFGYSKHGKGEDKEAMLSKKVPVGRLQNILRRQSDEETFEYHHWDYRPDLMETN